MRPLSLGHGSLDTTSLVLQDEPRQRTNAPTTPSPTNESKASPLRPIDLLPPRPPGEDFKGTTRTADGVECTLGRLVFNIFEPVNLPVLITEIRNTIGPRAEGAEPADTSFYNICTRWVARDGSGLKGQTEIAGECWEDPSKPERIMVRVCLVENSLERECTQS